VTDAPYVPPAQYGITDEDFTKAPEDSAPAARDIQTGDSLLVVDVQLVIEPGLNGEDQVATADPTPDEAAEGAKAAAESPADAPADPTGYATNDTRSAPAEPTFNPGQEAS
jgi:hypothetical protein